MANFPNVTIIDVDGDFMLTVGSKPFKVTRDNLLPSPFFKQLFADGVTSGTVSGNAEAAKLILDIRHFNNDDVAEDLDVNLFYEVAKLADEWKCVKSLGAYSRGWIKAWSVDAWDERKPQDWEKWIKIGGVFGKKDDIVQVVMKDMIKTAWDKMDEQEVETFKQLAIEYGLVELGGKLLTLVPAFCGRSR